VLDCADRRGGYAQSDRTEHVRENACSLQIGQITPFGLIVGMADIVPDLDAFAGDYASPRHRAPRSSAIPERFARPFFGPRAFFLPIPPAPRQAQAGDRKGALLFA
jgi:hypothetical protein